MTSQPVMKQSFYLNSPSDHRFHVTGYHHEQREAKGIVLIITGMAEHAGRYKEFSHYLAEHGYSVYIGDHPGQGKTAESPEKTGLIFRQRGWECMLENVRALYTHIRKEQPKIPIFIFGHSMGSLLARHFTALYPVYIQGLMLSGSFVMPKIPLALALNLVRLKVLIEGHDHKSQWFNKLFYWSFNRHFKPRPTLYEWISSMRHEVVSYQQDPYCGFFLSNGFFKEILKGIAATRKAESLITYRKTLPVLIMSGKEDPVGRFGKDAVKLHKNYYQQYFQNLSLKIFPGRHELLHEKHKEEVYDYLLNWLNESLTIK